jgi:hypothetical protein
MAVEGDIRGSVDGGTDVSERSRGRRDFSWTRSRWFAAVSITVTVLGFFALYVAKAAIIPVTSDASSNMLQAWSMLHGNPFLHGWAVSDVSFWTTELPEYAIIELFFGVNPVVIHVAAGVTWTLLVVCTALVARGRATGRDGLLRAAIAAGIVLAPTWNHPFSLPDHTGTMVPLLAVWLIVARVRPRWWVPVAVGGLLALTQIADTVAVYEGALPLALVGLLRVYQQRVFPLEGTASARPAPSRGRGWRGWRNRLRDWRGRSGDQWYELALAAAAVISTIVAEAAIAVIRHLGGFTQLAPPIVFNFVDTVGSHIGITLESVLLIFSADFSNQHLGAAVPALLHLPAVALALWGLWIACRRYPSQDIVVQGMVISVAFLLLSYTFALNPTPYGGAHEIVGVLPMTAVLAGRLLGPTLVRARLLPALALILACCVGSLVQEAIQPPAANPAAAVGNWLRAHHLDYGFSDYWDSNEITVVTENHVRVRALARNVTGTLVRRPWESDAAWYVRGAGDARFFIIDVNYAGCPNPAATLKSWKVQAAATFGAPVATYIVDGYQILVYNHNLLDRPIRTIKQGWPGEC